MTVCKKIRNKSGHRSYIFTKINSKWTKDLNVEHRITKLLEDYIRENLDDFWYSYVLLVQNPSHNP